MSAIMSSRVRLDRARQQSACCALCEHRCGANRLNGERGPCRAGTEARVFRHRVECGEELQLIPSHLFYLSGCDLRCAFCIAEENAFDPHRGTLLTGAWLRRAIPWGRSQGATNIQWVGGEPHTHSTRQAVRDQLRQGRVIVDVRSWQAPILRGPSLFLPQA